MYFNMKALAILEFGRCKLLTANLSPASGTPFIASGANVMPHYLVKFKWSTAQFNEAVSYMYAVLAGLIFELHKQQMSELPFTTVFQVLSLLEPCYER